VALKLAGTEFALLGCPPGSFVEVLSIFGMFNPNGANVNEVICEITNAAGNDGFKLTHLGGVSAGTLFAAKTINGSDVRAATAANVVVAGAWQWGLAQFFTTASRTIYHGFQNLSSGTNGSSGIFPVILDRVRIGEVFNGALAKILVVKGIISIVQAYQLAGGGAASGIGSPPKGASPYELFAHGDILFYAPLRDNLMDEISGRSLFTNAQNVQFLHHPVEDRFVRHPVFRPSIVLPPRKGKGPPKEPPGKGKGKDKSVLASGIEVPLLLERPEPPLYRRKVGATGTNTSASVTGVAGTGVAGTVIVTDSAAISGVTGTGVAGTVTVEVDTAPAGAVGTGVAGTVIASLSSTISGVTGTGVVGTVTVEVDTSIAGVAGTGVAGTVSVQFAAGLSGVFGTGVAGILFAEMDTTLAGVFGTGVAGTAAGGVGPAPAGAAGVGVAGTLGIEVDTALAGVFGTGAVTGVLVQTGPPLFGVFGAGIAANLSIIIGPAAVDVFGAGVAGNLSAEVQTAVAGVAGIGFPGVVSLHIDTNPPVSGVAGTGVAGTVVVEVGASLAGVFGIGIAAPLTVHIYGVVGVNIRAVIDPYERFRGVVVAAFSAESAIVPAVSGRGALQ